MYKDTKTLKVIGLDMKRTLDPPSASKIPNTLSLKGFYNSLLLSRIYSFTKLWKDIIFIINGKCCVFLERISYLEK